MKAISSSESALWNQNLVAQLAFIRKHLRFPIRPQIVRPLLAACVSALPILYFFSRIPLHRLHENGIIYLVLCMILIPFGLGILRYFRSLRFIEVPANPLLSENMQLVQRFLEENHFAYARHPEVPEVFQMISQNIGRRKELREALIFIADNGRILLNSHFTQNSNLLPPGNGKTKEMAQMLTQWMRANRGMDISTEICPS